MVECDGLENRYPFIADRGFESHSLLHFLSFNSYSWYSNPLMKLLILKDHMKTKRFLLDKLGQDKIAELFKDEGCTLKFHIVEDNDKYLDALTQKVVEELDVIQGRYETLEVLFWQMSQRLKAYNTEEVDKFLEAQYRNNGETLH